MDCSNNRNFGSALKVLPTRIKNILEKLPPDIAEKTDEIRIRADRPLTLTVSGVPLYVDTFGGVTENPGKNPFCVFGGEMDSILQMCCNSSVYSHIDELKNGFITLKNGCRVGIGADFSGEVPKNISSFNIRLSRQIVGVADKLADNFCGGMLIVGRPGCGKTTVLRDLIRSLSNGRNGRCRRVAVIDTRYEIGAASGGAAVNDLGYNTDILSGIEKSKGIEIALRTLFPDIIAFDEIGTNEELNGVMHSFNAGALIITTAHAGSIKELNRRPVTKNLLLSGAIDTVALLPDNHNGEIKIIPVGEVIECG